MGFKDILMYSKGYLARARSVSAYYHIVWRAVYWSGRYNRTIDRVCASVFPSALKNYCLKLNKKWSPCFIAHECILSCTPYRLGFTWNNHIVLTLWTSSALLESGTKTVAQKVLFYGRSYSAPTFWCHLFFWMYSYYRIAIILLRIFCSSAYMEYLDYLWSREILVWQHKTINTLHDMTIIMHC